MRLRYSSARLVIIGFLNLLFLNGYTQTGKTLFSLLPSSQTGITFKNIIHESDSLNILNQANIYNGGGVGIGDFNNDGLQDIYLAGNMMPNKLYLNKGALTFKDVTDAAGVDGLGRWCTGIAVVDINADGWMDIYASASFYKNNIPRRTNLLYINSGANKEGVPVFKESARAYGLADTGFSTQAYFFDYDRDGDLDLYQVTNELYDPKTPIKFRPKVTDGMALNTDRLYRNNGNATFTDVSKKAGIVFEGWGHAACITDINMDGWPDIYVANDFVSNDLCYINNKNGTFTNRLNDYFKHTGWNAMGTDAVDINNDGFIDFVSLEMLPETNMRKKRMLSGNEYYNYTNSAKYGYGHQYVRNVLQLNSGNIPGSHPVFNDIGYLAGIYETDWSWCPLVADFDNDGFRDIIISNGLPRDVTDLDYIAYNNGQGGGTNFSLAMTDSLPVVRLASYAFKNTNGVQFKNVTESWGFEKQSFSNGAAYGDLDNDGDLDVVINNINDEASLYENTLHNKTQGRNATHTLQVSIRGVDKNPDGIGATIRIYYAGRQQFYEHQPTRGYLSTHDYRVHFGLGVHTKIDSLLATWPDGKMQLLADIKSDQTLTISYKDASITSTRLAVMGSAPLFSNAAARSGITYKVKERDFVDYNIQPTIPHKLSQYGPGIAVGDIDNNGLEDFYLGGSSGNPGIFFIQDANGKFRPDSTRFLQKEDPLHEDMGVLLFDADSDKDLDLLVVGGSYEIPPNHPVSRDRFFENNGKGRFTKISAALPPDSVNGSCVRAADIDNDGDLDLFVGGRVVSGAYPIAPRSYILQNDNGKFTDITFRYAPQLQQLGMVTDALWSDFNSDGKVDLVLTGEWMPVTFLKNTGRSLVTLTNSGIDNHLGWWNSLTAADFDHDGDMDYVAGNLGLNTNYKASPEHPITLLAKDMDNNGSFDAMVFCYLKAEDGTMQPFPMATKEDLANQVLSTRKKFPTYKSYGMATLDDVWSKKDREGAMMLQANNMASSYIENKGNGVFELRPLPLEAQAAPIYGMLSEDVDADGNVDLLMVGNDYSMEPYSGRHDALIGVCLKGDGKGSFVNMPVSETGFFVKGDAKGLARLHTARGEDLYIATQNQDSLVVLARNPSNSKAIVKWISLDANDFAADILFKDGRRTRMEFYYGSTYLSQSSRKIPVGSHIQRIDIINYNGTKRQVL